jgi:iron(III) transport system substrate-binding protein
VLAVVVLLLACDACARGGSETAAGEVVLYTSIPSSVVDRLQGVVEQRFPDLEGDFWLPGGSGITLRVVRGRTADIERRIASDIEDGGMRADVIWLAEPSPYETYKELGLLAPLEPPPDAPVIDGGVDPDGFYVAGRIIGMGIAWNTFLWPDGLHDWPDLSRATSGAFPEPQSGAARATIKALVDEYGESFFTDLAAAGTASVASNGDARNGLVAGRFDAVAVLGYMARQARAEGFPVGFAYPAGGTVLIPSPIAITAGAANPEAARAFVDFILSRSGQEIVVQIGSFYPVRTDVAPPAGAPPLDSIPTLTVDWKELASETGAITEQWEEWFGTP